MTYQAGNTKLKGYIVWNDSVTGSRPGVIVVHEWWGHNEYARKRADMLARLGVNLKGVASFHGSLKTQNPTKPGGLLVKILGRIR